MMTPLSTSLQQEAIASFTHIFLSLDLMESGMLDEDHRSCLAIIRQNAERLQRLIQNGNSAVVPG